MLIRIDDGQMEPDGLREAYMWETEQLHHPFFDYMRYQPHLTPFMRFILVEWMHEICTEYALRRETFYMAISYVDRFLSVVLSATERKSDVIEDAGAGEGTPSAHDGLITKDTMQLLGTGCLLIACKATEVHPPDMIDFERMTNKSFSAPQLSAMELRILRALHWSVHPITPYAWLTHFLATLAFHASTHEEYTRFLSEDLFLSCMHTIDVVCMTMHSLRFYPSHLAAASLYWYVPAEFHADLLRATQYSYDHLQPMFQLIVTVTPQHEPRSLHALSAHACEVLNEFGIRREEEYAFQTLIPDLRMFFETHADDMVKFPWHCHTNLLRSFPACIPRDSTYKVMHAAGTIHPIRNSGMHSAIWPLRKF